METATTMDPKNLSKNWPGYSQLRSLFVFGDSYSAVGYQPDDKPSEETPLGVEFPGDTWAEDEKANKKPNWVGHLISKYYPKSPLLVYDYAVGGDNIKRLERQVKRFRQPGSPGHPDSNACWQGNNSLFVTWIGFNDIVLSSLNIQAAIDVLFQLQEELYEAGARNFLFMTTAPLPNASGGQRSDIREQREKRCRIWNETLTTRARSDFAEAHPDASIFIFDAWNVFEQMLKDPTKYGFSEKAGRGSDQEMYWDAIHPTTAVHRIVAKAVADFLAGESVVEDQPERFATPSIDS